jgi:acetolactate synthase-1/2/3 large subunit
VRHPETAGPLGIAVKDLALAHFDYRPEPLLPQQSPSDRTTAATVLLQAFADHGIRAAFGIPGGAASPIFDGLLQVPDLSFSPTRHEAIAGFAASGYARATGTPALVLTTSGPGLTNALTGVAAAALEELPVILVAGEVASSAAGRGALQDGSPAGLDVLSMVRSMTRWATTLPSAAAAAATAERAWQIATGPRPGPVYIGVPLDVGGFAAKSPRLVSCERSPVQPDRFSCRQAAHRLRAARRPLLILGNGARGAAFEARMLAERLALPVVVTGHAKGVFPESHPLYVGILGVGQHPSVAEYLSEQPDAVCVVGSRLGDIATQGWRAPICGKNDTIQIDRDPALLGANLALTMGIVGDARLALTEMVAALPSDVVYPQRIVPACRSARAELALSDSTPLKPQRVLAALSDAYPDATWSSDIGEHLTMALHYLRVEDPARFHAFVGFGSMGSGIGSAIGLKKAWPDRTVVCVCGDGGLAMHAGEILTCVENGINVIFAVFNDGRWNMIHHGFRSVYGRLPPALPSRICDLAAVASGFGALGVVIRKPEDLGAERLRDLARSQRPVVLDIRIDGSESFTAESRAATICALGKIEPRT